MFDRFSPDDEGTQTLNTVTQGLGSVFGSYLCLRLHCALRTGDSVLFGFRVGGTLTGKEPGGRLALLFKIQGG